MFRFTGALWEPMRVSETKILETVKWEVEKPYYEIKIDDDVKSFYSDEYISIDFMIFVLKGKDGLLQLWMNSTATFKIGFANSFNITFREEYQSSQVFLHQPDSYVNAGNLSLVDYADGSKIRGLKAFMELAGVNRPKKVHFGSFADWYLGIPWPFASQIEVRMELVYHNGTGYKRIVQPFQLKIGPDENGNFEHAKSIHQGVYSKLYLGGEDTCDFYKIYTDEGYTISINATGFLFFYLNLYNPERELKANLSKIYRTESINFTVDSTGEWFIQLGVDIGHGFYSLTINMYPPDGE
jgi:hypothetical protein